LKCAKQLKSNDKLIIFSQEYLFQKEINERKINEQKRERDNKMRFLKKMNDLKYENLVKKDQNFSNTSEKEYDLGNSILNRENYEEKNTVYEGKFRISSNLLNENKNNKSNQYFSSFSSPRSSISTPKNNIIISPKFQNNKKKIRSMFSSTDSIGNNNSAFPLQDMYESYFLPNKSSTAPVPTRLSFDSTSPPFSSSIPLLTTSSFNQTQKKLSFENADVNQKMGNCEMNMLKLSVEKDDISIVPLKMEQIYSINKSLTPQSQTFKKFETEIDSIETPQLLDNNNILSEENCLNCNIFFF
jgi:hypothetical protein